MESLILVAVVALVYLIWWLVLRLRKNGERYKEEQERWRRHNRL